MVGRKRILVVNILSTLFKIFFSVDIDNFIMSLENSKGFLTEETSLVMVAGIDTDCPYDKEQAKYSTYYLI